MADVLPPERILEAVEAAWKALKERPPTPGLEIFDRDRIRFLSRSEGFGTPHLFHTAGVPVRYLTPVLFRGRVGGAVASDPFTGEVLSWPAWGPSGEPLFSLSPDEVDRAVQTRDPRLGEFVPSLVQTPTRFAVDPGKLKDGYLLEKYEALPFKNQEERYSYVQMVNEKRLMKTRWRHQPGYQEPSYKCLSYATSTIVDWWGLIYGHPITSTYENFVNGVQEYGVNPRELEVLYHERAKRKGRPYILAPRVKLDPVTRERIPASSVGFAHLVTSPDRREVPDPLTRSGLPVYRYESGMYHMDGPPKLLFNKGRAEPGLIREALHRHGIVLAFTQARMFRVIHYGLHGIPIIGYFQRDGKTFFIYHESYGNHGPGYIWDDTGGPSYMTIPAGLLREASCFPHRLWVVADPAAGGMRVVHSAGGPLAGVRLQLTAPDGGGLDTSESSPGVFTAGLPGPGRIRVDARRDYFLREDGSYFTSWLPWGGPAPGLAAVSGWLMLWRQLEEARSPYRPPAILLQLEKFETDVIAASRTAPSPADPLAAVLVDRERSALQSILLPRLATKGISAAALRQLLVLLRNG